MKTHQWDEGDLIKSPSIILISLINWNYIAHNTTLTVRLRECEYLCESLHRTGLIHLTVLLGVDEELLEVGRDPLVLPIEQHTHRLGAIPSSSPHLRALEQEAGVRVGVIVGVLGVEKQVGLWALSNEHNVHNKEKRTNLLHKLPRVTGEGDNQHGLSSRRVQTHRPSIGGK